MFDVHDRVPGVSDVEPLRTTDTGEVLRGIDTETGAAVTIKVLAGKVSDEQFDRFTSTCRSIRSLGNNASIARLYDAGTTSDGFPYLVVERRARTLADLVSEQGRLRWQEAVAVGSEIAAGLDAAHRAGAVHGGLGPDAVLMTDDDEPLLTDFGVRSLLMAPDTTGASGGRSAVERLAHTAPEVIQGRPNDERSDVYSLASTLFAAIAGNPAFVRASDENVVPMVSRLLGEEPPSLSSLGVPREVESTIVSAMAKDPAMRPSTAALFRQELLNAARSASGTDVVAQTAASAGNAAAGVANRPAEAALGRRSDRTRKTGTDTPAPRRKRTIDLTIAGVAIAAVIAIVWIATSSGGKDSSSKSADAQTAVTDAVVNESSSSTSAAPDTTASTTSTTTTSTTVAPADTTLTTDATATSEVGTSLASTAVVLSGTGFHLTSWDNPSGGLTITYPADHQGHVFDISLQYTGNKNPLLCPARTRPQVVTGSTFSSLSFGGCLQDGQSDLKLRVKSWGKGTVKVSLYLCDVTRTVNW